MGFHKDQDLSEIHQIHNLEFDDRAAREGATYAASDVGKVVKQNDEGSYWIVLSTTPTFEKISAGQGVQTDTTDDTTTTIWSFTMTDNTAMSISARVLAKQSDASDRNFYWIEGLFYRDGGNATQQGSTVNVVTPIESDATPSVAFAVSGSEVRVNWAGITAENWSVVPRVEYEIL